MLAVYPTIYRDEQGEVITWLHNDGETLRMVVRGVEFVGSDFDGFEPSKQTDPSSLSSFTLHRGELCSYTLECDIPVPVVGTKADTGILHTRLKIGDPAPKGWIDYEHLEIELRLGEHCFLSSGESGWFEDELLDIQKQLPAGIYLKACINCAFSDYSPYGHGLFGCLACFRDNKDGYCSVQSKSDLFRIWDTMTEYVQETYVCPEFARRKPGTGYRG